MSKIGDLLRRFDEEAAPFTPDDVVSAWTTRLADLGLDGITVDSADVDVDGKTKLVLSNGGDTMEIGFLVKDVEGESIPFAVSLGDDDGQGALEIDLSNADVPVVDGGTGKFVDMVNLDWLTDEIANSLVGADAAIQAEPSIDDVPVGGEDDETPEDPDSDQEPAPNDGGDDLLGRDDPEDDEEERYVGIRRVEGKLKCEMVTKPCSHKILCRRARAAFRFAFEAMRTKREGRRLASLKARRR